MIFLLQHTKTTYNILQFASLQVNKIKRTHYSTSSEPIIILILRKKQTNGFKGGGGQTELSKNCTEENYFSFWLLLYDWCISLHACNYPINVRHFSCVRPVIDHEFRHNIVKVAMDPRGDSRVDPRTTFTMLRRNSSSLTGQTHEQLTSICFLHDNKSSNCLLSLVDELHKLYKIMRLSAY